MDYAYFFLFPPIFHLFSAYLPPEMVPHPYYKLKHVTHLPFFRPHVYGFRLFSAYFPPIFRLKFRPFSAGPVLLGCSGDDAYCLTEWASEVLGKFCWLIHCTGWPDGQTFLTRRDVYNLYIIGSLGSGSHRLNLSIFKGCYSHITHIL